MQKIIKDIYQALVEWANKLTPDHYIKAIGTLLKVIAIFIIARVIIRVSNIVISNFFKRRRRMKARMDTKKAEK